MITLSSYKPEPELEIFNVVSLSNNEKAVYSRLVSSLKSKYFSNAGKMVRMQWWAYLLMLMVYICYLLIGAAVFQKLESPFEEKRCKDAKAKVKDKKEEFGNEVLTLNLY